ncbi:glycosyltransferase [Sinomicrobium soli]|uniref:glycosyltransferase n=1 Tax=Sinomicrobium sp. N-1-3-6 TaxID=2219864 RepID=UPI000DCD011C|nr:glycosyltransferase [Sinomicrobium sp. N-1-3-6]RAV30987.1 hypothetical protein DN748_01710 [Sinomicrobium sp. N-1-3-6]
MQKEPLKLVIGITAPASVGLIRGQLKYFSEKGYKVYLLAPKDEKTIAYCERENCTLLPVNIKREISLWHDLKTFFVIINYFLKIKPDIINVGTPKVSLLGMIAAKVCGVKKRIYTCRGFRYESEAGKLKKLLVSFEKIIARYSHKIICISESVKILGERDGIFKGNKTIVIGHGSSNGLDLSLFAPGQVTEEKNYNFGLNTK